MTQKEQALAATLLKEASEVFSNNGCNDVDENIFKDWSIEERESFVKEYYQWNGSPEEYDKNYLLIPDFALMDFIADKLLKP